MILKNIITLLLFALSLTFVLFANTGCSGCGGGGGGGKGGGEVVSKIEISSLNTNIPCGLSQQMKATLIYSNGSKEDVTKAATWESNDDLTATVSEEGVVKGLLPGWVTISAAAEEVTSSITIEITDAMLISIEVTPFDASMPKGLEQQFTATGIFSDNSKQDITMDVNWSSSDTSVEISNAPGTNGLASTISISAGPVTISATEPNSGISAETQFTVSAATLVSIGITPAYTSVAKGLKKQFTAMGTYTDGSNTEITTDVLWSSSDEEIVTISNAGGTNGQASSIKTGTVTISAKLFGVNGETQFTVTAATLSSIGITPAYTSVAKGLKKQFTAMGTYTDGSNTEITADVLWSSSDEEIVTISNAGGTNGQASSIKTGTVTISAKLSGVSGETQFTVTAATLVTIGITPAYTSVAKGLKKQFTAMGTYTDSSNTEITTDVLWSSSDEEIVTISNAGGTNGQASSIKTGTVTISAKLSGVSGETQFTVTAAVLASISVTSSSINLPFPRTCQFNATGTYTDGTTQPLTTTATWSSSSTSVATISNAATSNGIVSTIAEGSTIITAEFEGKSGSTALNVTAAELVSITVSPVNSSLASGMDLQFQATGVYDDNSTQDLTTAVTWSSSSSSASISNAAGSQGLAHGVSAGTATIAATLSDISGSTSLTVNSVNLIAVSVTPVKPSIAKGTGLYFTATGTFSDSSTQDITTQVTWSSSDTSKATISNAAGSKGFATAVAPGSVAITATKGSLSSDSTLTITAAILESITITPNNPICYGTTQQFKATGTYSDSTTQDITASVTWSSSDTTIATISNSSGSNGLATSVSVSVETTIIKATLGTVSNTTSLAVRDLILQSLTITPANPSVSLTGKIQFTAAGTYNDGTVQDLTTQVLWSASDISLAVISNAAGSQGLATPTGTGTLEISARRESITGSTTLTVTQDYTAPVISAATLVSNSVQVTYSKPVNITQASSISSYKIVPSLNGECSVNDNSVFTSSVQTSDFSITSVSVVSPSVYVLYVSFGMQNMKYYVIADRTQIRDLSGNNNYLGCPNNQDFYGVDDTPPTVSSAVSLNPTTVRVTYSENVNPSEANNTGNYKIIRAPAQGSCSDNTNFTLSSQTSDFSIASISGTGKVYDIALSATQSSGASYTLLVKRSSIYDTANNYLGCPNNADFTGLEQLKVSSAYSVTTNSFIVVFSKPVLAGVNAGGSAECNSTTECSYRYLLTGSSNLGMVSKATVLNGSVCGGVPADSTKVCVEHTVEQGGGQYTITVANSVNGDGFDNSGWGSIRNSGNTENMQLAPKDRTSFVGSGTAPQNFGDGPVTNDPFNDNSSFGYLASYGGKIYIGPNSNGNGAQRFNPDGSAPEGLSFDFNRDGTTDANELPNSAATRDGGIAVPPYVTMGHTGCTQNNANLAEGCGPYNNNGRGLFTSGMISGVEHLFITGGRSAGYNYHMYWTIDTDTNLNFNYIDLSNAFKNTVGGLQVAGNKGTESINIFNDKIYWMSPGDRSYRPYLMKINDKTAESVDDTNSRFMMLTWMPGFGYLANTRPNRADKVGGTMFTFNNILYIANSGSISDSSSCNINTAYSAGICEQTGGIIRSSNTDPGNCTAAGTCNDWRDITPASVKFRQFFSDVLTKVADLIPADRPIPGFAEFNGNLYMIRNACTTSRWNRGCTTNACSDDQNCPAGQEVPQLWKCDPTISGDPATCESDDWSIVAENDTTGKTNMGNANNNKITLIATNGISDKRLYIGYDNADGVQMWRTKAGITNPTSESNFEQVGGSGLGDPVNNLQMFSAVSLQQGLVSYIYISAGNNGVPVKVYRQQND